MLFSFLFYKFVLAPVFFLHWMSKKIVSNGEGWDSASLTHSSNETVRLYLQLYSFRTLTCYLLGPVSRLFRFAFTALSHNFSVQYFSEQTYLANK